MSRQCFHLGVSLSLLGSVLATEAASAGNVREVVSITVSPLVEVIQANGSPVQYQAIATYSDGSLRDVTDMVTWSVDLTDFSGMTCASFNAAGMLTPGYCNGWGTTLSATLGSVTGIGYIIPTKGAAQMIMVTPLDQSMLKGATQQYTAMWSQEGDFEPAQNYTTSVTWNSSNPSVATIDAKGVATAVAPGKTVISSSYAMPEFLNGSIALPNNNTPVTLMVMPCDITGIGVIPSVSMYPNGVQQLQAQGGCKDGSLVDVTSVVEWAALDTTIAMVSPSGLLAGWKAGQTTVTASVNGVTSPPISIDVQPNALLGITITPTTTQLAVGGTQQFTATGNYQNGSPQDITSFVTWSTDAPSTLSVDPAGLATGVAAGSAEIVATVGNVASPAAMITVTAAKKK